MFGEIFRFELAFQFRRRSTVLYFVLLLAVTFHMAREMFTGEAQNGRLFNAPIVIAIMTLVGTMLSLIAIAAITGDAATRDAQRGMAPLLYTTPLRKLAYLGGRFLAAFTLGALLLTTVPLAHLLAAPLSGLEAELLGPVRVSAYLSAFATIALPNAFIATAVLFSLAVLTRRAVASYVGAAFLVVFTIFTNVFIAKQKAQWQLGKLIDPLGLTVLSEFSRAWTLIEKNTRLVAFEQSMLSSRLLWMGIAAALLAVTHYRFQLAHYAQTSRKTRAATEPPIVEAAPVAIPDVPRAFHRATRMRQMLAVALDSFRELATSRGALAVAAVAVMLVLQGPEAMEHLGMRPFPTTARVIQLMGGAQELPWMVAMFLTVFYAGELVWRERDARLHEISDVTPVRDWAFFTGKFAGLALALVALQVMLAGAGMLVQLMMGFTRFEPILYAKTLLGLRLSDYLLFALLAVAVHTVVAHKYVGHLIVLGAYGFTAFAPALGLEHNLLIYGSDPGWRYSDMRGFGRAIAPVLWFKLYWAAWALLLAVAAKLLWVRGAERNFRERVRLARGRFTRPAITTIAAATALILLVGGFIFYNTDVLNAQPSREEHEQNAAEYERRYKRYQKLPQPRLSAQSLRIELHPERGEAEIRGLYRLENRSGVPIDQLHVGTAWEVETDSVQIDRPFAPVTVDRKLRHHIYALKQPLAPGESMRLLFRVRFAERGFSMDDSVSATATHFEEDWLPAIGYQPDRELSTLGERAKYGLKRRPEVPSLNDVAARHDTRRSERFAFEAIIGTAAGQTAIAPGALRRTWTDNGRRYFHYVTDSPISNSYSIFSAAYAVHKARWNDVEIEIFHHPGHPWNREQMARSIQASLSYFTREFGPYPHRQLRMVEAPGASVSLRGHPVNIRYFEHFASLNPGPERDYFPFAVASHEVAHQWWGNQLTPAQVEGAAVLSETLAWYSAIGAVQETYGRARIDNFMELMREAYFDPRAKADVPLLRAGDWYLAYRKGPFAMYALREYIGEQQVNLALRRLLQKHGAGGAPLPTTLDLYAELEAVTPAHLRYLLVDLFQVNTFWELQARQARSERIAGGGWRVTLDVTARKVAVDEQGAETERPMNDLIDVGVYGSEGKPPLYLQKHRIRAGQQRIVITVPHEPVRAGIDPRNLLIDVQPDDNVTDVQ